MIKTTIEGLLMTRPILQELTNVPLSAKESFKVYRTLKSLEKEYELALVAQ
mgnify:CR=1 FL=1